MAVAWTHKTTSACCVIEQNDENPCGLGQGVCNTPLHDTKSAYCVIVGAVREPPVYRDMEERTHIIKQQQEFVEVMP